MNKNNIFSQSVFGLGRIAGVSLVVATLSLPSVNAATGTTSVTVDFPETIILHYRESVGITFTGDVDSATNEGDAGTISIPLTAASGDGTITAGGTATTTIPVTVDNMWAVRGVTSSGNFSVSGAITTDTATTGPSSTTMADLELTSGAASGATITVASEGLAVENAVYGGITFNLDITGVTRIGSHTGIEYTITVTAP